ncbi:DUF1501 domain-containing protein [Gimesia chilikensis]|uniref:DUF1501 domain-containing protein n=1 Tax=Gimesia chilikensis TaxID=2605989 RepID=A0A517PJK5_9PLAN|nr:DUF1501 domain-containing protein [Gimesia chilikensis]QDT19564.1 hypothetical protein HG66A1_13290 [Gimesia chilikensis]
MHRLQRRDFLYGMGASLGTVAFNALLQAEQKTEPKQQNLIDGPPLAPRDPHLKPRAKACIFLFMEGGPSHIDTFDPKPALEKLHLKEFVREDKQVSAMASGKRYYIKSPFQHRQAGESGISLSEHFSHLSEVADDLCVYHGLQAESINHPTACYHMNTGNRFGGDPAIGSWMTYGLGTENQNLPAFIVLPEVAYPQGGAANWSNGFLPAYFQGTALRSTGSPILDLNPPPNVTRETQRKNLDLLAKLNQQDQQRHPHEEVLAARMESYELAFRMQTQVPDIINLESETQQTQDMYGLGQKETDSFGRRCLLARKLVESGVRFVQIYAAGWDSHDFLERSHKARMQAVDQPIAALLKDLKARGLLDETLVVWTGEFGRSPDNGIRSGRQAAGRDHNAKGMAMWMAGGGVKAGHRIGATDEIGDHAVEVVNPIRNLHVTLEHIMGLDDNQLTYFHEGRFKVLSQTGGAVIKELLG